MPLEAATYIDQLVITNPTGGDKKSQGDDQFRLIKSVLKNTFPTGTRAFNLAEWAEKRAAGIIEAADRTMVAADDGKSVYFDCTAASRTYDLLDIASAPVGTIVFVTRDKTTIANTLTITAAGAELINGAASVVVRAGESGFLYKLNTLGNEWAFFYTRTRQDFLFTLQVVLAAAGDAAVYESTLASAARSPDVVAYRNRNGVNNDILGSFAHRGKNTAGTQKDLARWRAKWIDVAVGSEDAQSIISTLINNVEVDAVTIGAGAFLGAATGGDKGIGTLNATGYYVNGVLVNKDMTFKAHKNGVDQGSITVEEQVTFSTEEVDANGNFAANAFTPQVPGFYFLYTQIRWGVGANAEDITLVIKRNGVAISTKGNERVSTFQTSQSATVISEANGTTDTFTVHASSSVSKNIQGDADATYFMGFKVL